MLRLRSSTLLACRRGFTVATLPPAVGRRTLSSSSSSSSSSVKFRVNNKVHTVNNPEPDVTLLEYLRSQAHLTGAKLVCGEGGCGACCVAVAHPWRTVNACLYPLAAADGHSFYTVEGMGNNNNLHNVQKRMAECFGSQCGYCTPGFVTNLWTTLQRNPGATYHELMESLNGSLCRCTGYRSIAEAVRQIVADRDSSTTGTTATTTADPDDAPHSTALSGMRSSWHSPSTLAELLELKHKYPNARVVVGNTEVGIEQRFMNKYYDRLIYIQGTIPELQELTLDNGANAMVIGAAVPLQRILDSAAALANRNDGSEADPKYRGLHAIRRQLELFAGPSIRAVATVGGNVMTASPISDLNPLLVAFNAQFVLAAHGRAERTVAARDFFVDYRKVAAEADETLVRVIIPHANANTYQMSYKQSRRREDDIAIANAGISVEFDDSGVVKNASLCFGGMGRTPVIATAAAKALMARPWDESTYNRACVALARELALPENVPGGMPDYRTALCLGFFTKFYHQVNTQHHQRPTGTDSFTPLSCPPQTGTPQYPHLAQPNDVVGQPVVHASAVRQTTGEAVYVDDLPAPAHELKAVIVPSRVPHGRVKNIPVAEIEALPGVTAVYTHRHVPGSNLIGDIVHDELVLAEGEVTWVGQPVALVVAADETVARRAAVQLSRAIEYEELPSVMTIDDAIEAQSFFDDYQHEIVCGDGDMEAAMASADHVVSGEVYIGGQEHFYLEPHTALAVPEDTEMTVYSSTQNLNKTQLTVASVLGVPANRVPCSVRRLGGGFGGKETSSIHFACLAAVAAHSSKRPVRLVLGRDEDFRYSGKRHPFKGVYRYGVMNDGRIVAGDVHVYSNGGYSHDLSQPVTDRALFHLDNAYKIPNYRVRGTICKTNQVTNTAFRGFGGPQGMFIVETGIEKIATTLGVPPHEIRARNLYRANDTTHYGQVVTEDLQRLWAEGVAAGPGVQKLLAECDEFNRTHTHKKRGVGIVPAKFGLSFTATFLNQGSALVHIYTDGSVLVNHGGVEMGQGLHTKVQQIAAQCLGIPFEQVYISDSSTAKIPNASATAASMGSDIYGAAVLRACEELKERLEPYRAKNPTGTFADWVSAAYFDRTSLSAQGYHKVPVGGYNFDTGKGQPFMYFTCGVATTQVEVDTLTGDHRVLRTDIVMDVGDSINPMIDIGQIEGAFVQGQGWLTMEELVWGDKQHAWLPRGHLFTAGPGAYKIPAADDIPREFNVALFANSPNVKAVHSSRGIGEPPILLAYSVVSALRHAIQSARRDNGVEEDFDVVIPMTCERIRMLSCDPLTKLVLEAKKIDGGKWQHYQALPSV